MIRLIILILPLLMSFPQAQAQSVLGKWKTFNEDNGNANSIMEVYEEDGEIKGKVLRILKEENRDKKCTNCEGEMKNRPIEGLTIMHGLKKEGTEYTGGTVTDPKSGKVYKCKIWLDDDNPDILNIRGYIAFFFRTQTWKRVE